MGPRWPLIEFAINAAILTPARLACNHCWRWHAAPPPVNPDKLGKARTLDNRG
jgi:hypothetical protein